MSDEQVVERLAKREGWRLAFAENDNTGKYVYWITDPDDFLDTVKYDSPQTLGTVRETQAYLESHDALQPILEGLSDSEWRNLDRCLCDLFEESDIIPVASSCGRRWILTMPPSDLAHAIASILEDKQPCPCTIDEPCSYACPCANPLMSGVCAKCRQLRELVADAIDKAVAEKQIMLGNADAIIGAQVETITEQQAEIDRLKAELERLAGERDTWRKRFEAQPSTYQLAAIEQERDRLKAELERVTGALKKINDIRNSIVGSQSVNWSEHIYPLVAALNDAGLLGMNYAEAKKGVGTLIERTNQAEQERDTLRAQLEEAYQLVSDCIAPVAEVGKRRSAFLQRVKQTS